MTRVGKLSSWIAAMGIFFFCFGYFATYVPYSMMTKMVTKGLLGGMGGIGFDGFQIQPVAVMGSTVAILVFLTLAGWWKYATHSTIMGISFPRPQWFTFLSGLCTGGVIITTTLAYTFNGISIVFAMLLMRGGVLVMAPVVDLLSFKRKRKIYWPSWVAAIISFGALFVAFESGNMAMKVVAAVDIGLYLTCYFIRFFIMSSFAKSSDIEEKKRYFTEEQMTANIVLFLAVMVTSLVGSTMAPSSIPGMMWNGLTELPFTGYFWPVFCIGILSFGTGVFGGLIFLDRREHTFTVPANRVSSVLSGVVATCLLAVAYGQRYPDKTEWIGVSLIVAAIYFLYHRAMIEKRRLVTQQKASCQMAPAEVS